MKKTTMSVIIGAAFLQFIFIGVTAKAQQSAKLSDPEIASVAVTANQIDIEYAEIALERSNNPDVLNFAKTMKNDHQAVISQAVSLVQRLKVTPLSNFLTKKLLEDSKKTKSLLNSKKAKSFDKFYIENEISYHKAVINVVETILIPETENREVRLLLENVLPALKTHLSHAEMLNKKIAQ
jgi:putative membrane protein